MKPDHDEARKWAEEMLRLDSVSPLGKTANTARCYLDAMAREQRAVEFLQIIANWERTFDDPGAQAMADRIDAFLAERGEV